MNNPKNLEAMGSKLSVDCGWNGLDILEVAIAALTDANFHQEAKVLEQMLKALNQANAEFDLSYQLAITEQRNEIPF